MTKLYEIVLKRSVLKDIRGIPQSILLRIQDRIAALATDPFPSGAEPIGGYDHCYRIRLGNYRIVYEVATTIRIITIIR
ncbi:MAG: type II toxin-antitoxin system RelE/ParE family toxin, partial [Candidatus Peregrinibacteria bacterium]|nr:type II toxin-antitoxin system RelE/ParE family toxin [Candidatus Peregrinibacteria bacterium]